MSSGGTSNNSSSVVAKVGSAVGSFAKGFLQGAKGLVSVLEAKAESFWPTIEADAEPSIKAVERIVEAEVIAVITKDEPVFAAEVTTVIAAVVSAEVPAASVIAGPVASELTQFAQKVTDEALGIKPETGAAS